MIRLYEFDIIIDYKDIDSKLEDAVIYGKCDDTLICKRNGDVRISFARLAPSMKHAVLKAISDVESLGLDLKIKKITNK